MPTIIDSLIVTLGLDSSKFDSNRKKVDKGLKETEKAAGSAAREVGKFLAVVGGTVAIQRFAQNLIESNAALERFSRNLNANVSTVSAWSNAAEVAGGSAEGLQGAMDMLSRSQTELQLTGQSSLTPYLSALGVAIADVGGKARPVDAILLDLSERFQGMDRATAFNTGRMLGLDAGTMNLLLRGRLEVEAMIRRQKEATVVTKQQAEQSSKLQESMVRMRQSYEAFGRELLSRATPALQWLFGLLERFGGWIRANQQAVEIFLSAVAVGAGAIVVAAMPINLTAAAIIGLAGAFALLYQDYLTWKNAGGDTLIPWEKWEPRIRKAVDGIKWLTRTLMDAGYRMAAFLDMTYRFYSGDRKGAKRSADAMLKGMSFDDTAGSTGAPAGATAGGSPAAFFESRGWSKAQAAGIVANLQAESAMRPDAVGDNGKAYGIAQWHPDRQEAFRRWAGKDIRQSTLDEQLAFVHYELTEGNERVAGAALRNAITADQAGRVVSEKYERPADREGEANKRGRLARSLFLGIPGASRVAEGAGAQNKLAAAGGSVSVENNIGEVKVYTQATDAEGIARDMGESLDFLFSSQSDLGLVP